jgi:hypothetical protein
MTLLLRLQKTVEVNLLECCDCATPIALTVDQERRLRESGATFYCALGHAQSWRETELDRLRAKLAEQTRIATIQAERAAAAERAEQTAVDQMKAAAREAKRLERRAKAGVCPCCQRSFVALRRHMAAKHPGFAP